MSCGEIGLVVFLVLVVALSIETWLAHIRWMALHAKRTDQLDSAKSKDRSHDDDA